jgi:hypothetical protein
MSQWIFTIIQFFPLSSFAAFAFWGGTPSNERWLDAYQLGALLGLIQLAILLPVKNPLNRLILAGNLYLILGGLAAFFQQWWYLQLYDVLRESAIILLIIVIGLATTLFSSSGFIAVKASERKYSLYLLLATILIFPFAILFEGNQLYAVVLPIVSLSLFQRYLAKLAEKQHLVKAVD